MSIRLSLLLLLTPFLLAQGLVVSQDRHASKAGAAILRQGGHAVDGAVATAFALAVTHPLAGNIGGGGFLVLREASGEATSYDFREKAPLVSKPEMFIQDGRPPEGLRHEGAASAGVPGSVAGLHLAWKRKGRLPWARLLAPAIALAEKGFPVGPALAASLKEHWPRLAWHKATVAAFGDGSGQPLRQGQLLRQPDLAKVLRRIAQRGPAGFYEGETAKALVAEMVREGGLITHEDLKAYRAVERPVLRGTYRGWEVLAMGPPSSGGQVLLESLNLLEGFDLAAAPEARRLHLMAESLRRAFRDRARHLGDPEANPAMPLARLVSKAYAGELRKGLDPAKVSVSDPAELQAPESEHTTHLSVVDRRGNAVALTTTLEESWGNAMVVPGAGFLLNNEMGDFNAAPGLTDREGRIGTAPNLARPGARMLSSMCPAILVKGNRLLVLGSPGGRTIPSTVLGLVVGLVDLGLDPQAAVDAPHLHHQWLPDVLRVEPGLPEAALEALGHRLDRRPRQGCAQIIDRKGTRARGAADGKRWEESAAVME